MFLRKHAPFMTMIIFKINILLDNVLLQKSMHFIAVICILVTVMYKIADFNVIELKDLLCLDLPIS